MSVPLVINASLVKFLNAQVDLGFILITVRRTRPFFVHHRALHVAAAYRESVESTGEFAEDLPLPFEVNLLELHSDLLLTGSTKGVLIVLGFQQARLLELLHNPGDPERVVEHSTKRLRVSTSSPSAVWIVFLNHGIELSGHTAEAGAERRPVGLPVG